MNLKSCPFCGESNQEKIKVHARDCADAWVECLSCKSKGAFIKLTKDEIKEICKERAVEAWNRRTK